MILVDPPRTIAYRVFLVLTALAAAVIGAVLDLSGLFGLAFGLTAYLAIGHVLSRRGTRGIEVAREVYASAFEKDQVPVTLRVMNPGNSTFWLLEVSDRFGPSLAGKQTMLEPGPLSPKHQRVLGYVGVAGKHWGVYDCGPVTLATSDPMGLFTSEADHGTIESFAIFPRVLEIGSLPVQGSLSSLVPQDSSAGRPGQGAVYLGIRDYRAGDELRRIHWPATARRGKPMVREMEMDLVPYLSLFVDFEERHRAGMGLQSTQELIVRTASSILWTASRSGCVFQVFGEPSTSLYLEPGVGQGHLTSALYQLIRAPFDGKIPVLEVVDSVRGHLPRGSVAAILCSHVRLDLHRLEQMIDELRAQDVQPALFVCNNFSFRQVEGFAPPAAEQEEMVAGVEEVIRRQSVPGLILNRRTEEGAQQEDLALQLQKGLA